MREAVAVAKQQVSDLYAPEALQNVRLEHCLYDDHFAVWSVTIEFALAARPETRSCKIVRVSEADKSVLSIKDP